MTVYLVMYRAKHGPGPLDNYDVPVGIFSSEVNAVAGIHEDWQELETDPRDYFIKEFTLDERKDPSGNDRV